MKAIRKKEMFKCQKEIQKYVRYSGKYWLVIKWYRWKILAMDRKNKRLIMTYRKKDHEEIHNWISDVSISFKWCKSIDSIRVWDLLVSDIFEYHKQNLHIVTGIIKNKSHPEKSHILFNRFLYWWERPNLECIDSYVSKFEEYIFYKVVVE